MSNSYLNKLAEKEAAFIKIYNSLRNLKVLFEYTIPDIMTIYLVNVTKYFSDFVILATDYRYYHTVLKERAAIIKKFIVNNDLVNIEITKQEIHQIILKLKMIKQVLDNNYNV